MELWFVDKDQVDEVWKDVKYLIEQTDDTETDSDDIYQYLRSGHWSLWIFVGDNGIQVAGTTSFVYYGNKKMCRIETVAGTERGDWLWTLQEVEEWAKLNECIAMDIFGRKGWEKVLKPFDYNFEAVLLRKYF